MGLSTTLSNSAFHLLLWLGRRGVDILRELGGIFVFFLQGVGLFFQYPFQLRKVVQQIYFIGVKSIFVIVLVGMFTGMVVGLQGYYTLVKFGSEGVLGGAVALSLIREMGPVLTAIMVIGRAGSAMAAEIGIMRITEQIDALDTMNINPVRYLFSPRIAASVVCFPLLTALFDVVGIVGGYLTGVVLLGINSGIYFSRMENMVLMADITGGFYKSFVFGLLIVTICCYQGYYVHTRKDGFGAKGVSLATTSAVVLSSVSVLVFDYVLTSFLL
jgi:phospholipid/cholesterol/gamma-HCH transport system permease protein